MDAMFHVLDTRIRLTGPPSVVRPIAAAYSRFAVPVSEAAATLAVDCGESHPETILAGGRSVPLLPDVDPAVQVYRQFLATLLGNIRSHAVLHAAAVAGTAGDGVLIAAPSGFGKSSLALGMVDRGCRFLGDDYAPLDLETCRISPYPRAVSVIPGGDAPLPEDFRNAALDPGVERLFGKALLDVGRLRGGESLQAHPAELRRVFILVSPGTAWDDWNAPTLLDVAGDPSRREMLEEAFRSIPGVEIEKRIRRSDLHIWSLRLDHREHPTRALTPVLESDAVFFLEKHWEGKPDFTGTPSAHSIKRRRAAELLGREILNRRSTDRLMERYGGNVTALFLDLASALRNASCWSVRGGRYDETVGLLWSLIRNRRESGSDDGV
jgi:hypothetical protein